MIIYYCPGRRNAIFSGYKFNGHKCAVSGNRVLAVPGSAMLLQYNIIHIPTVISVEINHGAYICLTGGVARRRDYTGGGAYLCHGFIEPC